jgi:hypothetical protein
MPANAKKSPKLVAVATSVSTSVALTPPAITGTLMMIPVKDIQIDPVYQRTLNREHVRKIAANWDWALFKPLSVSIRPDGSKWCYDGHHGQTAAVQVGITELPCFVVPHAGREEEADSFVKMNIARLRLKPIDEFNGRVAALQKEQIYLSETLAKFKVTVTGDTKCGIGKTNAINAFMSRLDGKSGKSYTDAMKDVHDCITLIDSVWSGQPKAFSGRAVEGVFRLISQTGDRELLMREFPKRMACHSIEDILAKADRIARASQKAAPALIPSVMLEALNYRIKKNRIA